jgi:hypothetical protein
MSQRFPSLAEWFEVRFDEAGISLNVNAPNRSAWQAQISWTHIIRVCFKARDLEYSDEIYIFTDERPESYLIPTEANGGAALWDEIVRRQLFDAEVAIEAMASTKKLFCCPEK